MIVRADSFWSGATGPPLPNTDPSVTDDGKLFKWALKVMECDMDGLMPGSPRAWSHFW